MADVRPVRALFSTLACTVVFGWLPVLSAPPAVAAEPGRFFPAKGAVAYLEFDGLDAHLDVWKATEARAILEGTPAGAVMSQLASQVADRILKEIPDAKFTGADLVALQDHLTRHGFAFAVYSYDDGSVSSTTVLRGVGRNGPRGRLERFLGLVNDPTGAKKLPAAKRLRGRDVYQIVGEDDKPADPDAQNIDDRIPQVAQFEADGKPEPAADAEKKGAAVKPAPPKTPGLSYWFEGDDLVVVTCEPVTPDENEEKDKGKKKPSATTHENVLAAAFDVAEGKLPGVSTHPGYAVALAEGKDIKGFESDGLFFIELVGNQGLVAGLSQKAGLLNLAPYSGITLPSAKYMKDDVQYFTPAVVPAPIAPVRVEPVPPAPPALVAPPRLVAVAPAAAPAPVASAVAPVAVPLAVAPAAVAPTDPKAEKEAEKVEVDPAAFLGLDGVARIVGRWGFQGKGLLTDVRVETSASRKGLVGLLDQPGFRKDSLPLVPEGVSAFAIGSFDPGKSYEKLVGLVETVQPDAVAELAAVEQEVNGAIGFRLREDLLNHLGPTWAAFEVPAPNRVRGGKKVADPMDYVVTVGVKDSEAFGKVIDAIAERANKALRDREGNDAKGEADPPILALEALKPPERGYRLTSPAGLVPWLNDGVQPTVIVGKSVVAFAASTDRARAVVGSGGWKPTGELAKTLECLPAELTSLSVGDPSGSSWPELIENLPASVQILGSMLLDSGDMSPAGGLLAAIGLPQPGGFRVRIDPAKVPKADDLARHLFPSVLATSLDSHGLRFISREAFPFACVEGGSKVDMTKGWSNREGWKDSLKLKFSLGKLGGG